MKRKGYFVATVDREISSTFTITAYNKNGSTQSYPYQITPLTPDRDIKVSIIPDEESIWLNINGEKGTSRRGIASCEVTRLGITRTRTEQKAVFKHENNRVDISSLEKGLYLLNATDTNGVRHSFKFTKR